MIEKLVEIGILYDFYGKMLSERQYAAIELYYIHDLSLAEIGEELNITRQGVFDTLKRAESKLYEYESVLGLVNKFDKTNKDIGQILKITSEIYDIAKKSNNIDIQDKSQTILKLGKKLLDNSRGVVN
ncbi:MAG: DNA-binding protein [Tissierellia bacterium]|nr:DNA-binding protein [Tissierellia bacterium]